MNVAIHSAYGLIYLHIAAFLIGSFTALVFMFGRNFGWISAAIKSPRFEKFGPFRKRLRSSCTNRVILCLNDINACLLGTSLLLSASFVLNSGNFRLFAVATALAGFYCGKYLLSFLLDHAMILPVYFLKLLYDTVSFPICFICKRLYHMGEILYGRLLHSYLQQKIKRHTKRCMRSATSYAEYGFAEKFYKEL